MKKLLFITALIFFTAAVEALEMRPPDGATGVDTSTNLFWAGSQEALSFDVYFGDDSPPEFQGNQTASSFDPGILQWGTQYYWQIDEIREHHIIGEITVPGELWTFTTAGKAEDPSPADGARHVDQDVELSWLAFGCRRLHLENVRDQEGHVLYFGTTTSDVDENADPYAVLDTGTYSMSGLGFGQTYYWRVDIIDKDDNVYTGDIWKFTVRAYTGLSWVRDLGEPKRAWPAQGDDNDKLEFDVSYAPAAADGMVFVPSMVTDSVTAYCAENGEKIWNFHAGGPVRLAPAAYDGNVYFVSDDGKLYCLDADTGTLNWNFKASPGDNLVLGNERVISLWPARGAPVVKDGTVYFAAGIWPLHGVFVYALDAENGEIIWSTTDGAQDYQRQPHGGAYAFAGYAPQGYLVASGDRLVVSGGRTPPALFDRNTGELIHFNLSIPKGIGGYMVETDGEYYYNHGMRYRLSDGSDAGSGYMDLDPVPDDVLEYIEGDIFTIAESENVLLVVTKTGTLYAFGAEAPEEPIVYDYEVSTPEGNPQWADIAGEMLDNSDTYDGYALSIGVGDGDLLEEIAIQSNLHIVGIDNDESKITALRQRFADNGLYGHRIALLNREPDMHYPPYISSLVIVQEPENLGMEACLKSLENIYSLLRPYSGKAFILTDQQEYADAVSAFDPANGSIEIGSDYLVLSRDGAIPGAGQWTHQYANSGQTVVSSDDNVQLPLGINWFGGVSNENVLPRHHAGPRPQVAGGRLVILGVETISARDVYTGQELWVKEFPGIGHPFTNLSLEERYEAGESVYMTNAPGASYIGSPYVTLPDSIYLRYNQKVYRLDPDTGETLGQFPLPGESIEPDWGHISVYGDVLITTTEPHIYEDSRLGGENWDGSASDRLVVLDRFTGDVLWQRFAEIGFRHNAIISGNGRVFVIDRLSDTVLGILAARGETWPDDAKRVIALDAQTGEELWSKNSVVFGTFLIYSKEYDILVEGGTRDGRRHRPDEPRDKMIARDGSDGSVIWERAGRYDGPVAIRGGIITPGRPGVSRCLFSGDNFDQRHPMTREKILESYDRSYGCGTANATENLLLFRSAAAGYTDLSGATGNFGGFRSGCTSNMIPADGILNAPDYTRTCNCSYQQQTSLGLVHMPDADLWQSFHAGRGSGAIKQGGVNLGAPGNRIAENGTLWVHYPQGGARTPNLNIQINPGVDWFGKHTLSVDSSQGLGWVASFGAEGVTELSVNDVQGGLEYYTVTLDFAEPEEAVQAGERVFDVYIQGDKVLSDFDVVSQAGGSETAIRRHFRGIEIGDSLTIELQPVDGSDLMPVLSGMEFRVQLADLTGDGHVTFTDYSKFSSEWRREDCDSLNDWCNGADLLRNGFVGINDLALFLDEWLSVDERDE